MLYNALPSFKSTKAWTLEYPEDGMMKLGDLTLSRFAAISIRNAGLGAVEEQRLRLLDSINHHGSRALKSSERNAQIDQIAEINETLAGEPTYAMLHTGLRHYGDPNSGKIVRVAILCGFMVEPSSPDARHQITRVLEGKNGALGRRYDPVGVLRIHK